MNNVSGYSPCSIYGQILSVKLFYAVGGSFLLCAPDNSDTFFCPIAVRIREVPLYVVPKTYIPKKSSHYATIVESQRSRSYGLATVLLRRCTTAYKPLHRSIATLRPQYGCVERSYGSAAV